MNIVIDENGRSAFIVAGTGSVTIKKSIELTHYAEAAGADAVSVITPYFIKHSDEELREHFLRIAESVNIPLLAYNNLGCTDVPISAEVMAATASVVPDLMVTYIAERHELVLEQQRTLTPLHHTFNLGSLPVVVKNTMELIGILKNLGKSGLKKCEKHRSFLNLKMGIFK